MDRDFQTLLLRDNPWLGDRRLLGPWLKQRLPAEFYRRDGLPEAATRWREADRAHLVIGPRQAGKSTAVWAHLAECGEPVLFLDCEQALVREQCRDAPLFLASLESLLGPTAVPLFFEEAQHLEEASLFLKGLVDRRIGVPILVTGSSSYHLGARTRESLAGRATRTRLLPFSLEEVCQDLAEQPPLVREQVGRRRLDRHLVVGGYPAAWLSVTPETVLGELVEAVILRDASDFFRVGRPDAFRRLLQLAAAQVGNLVNLTEWASILGVSRDTVASYVEILEGGHVVASVPPFAGGKRVELTSRPKLFFVDSGIRNRLVHDFKPFVERVDRGPLFENWVFSQLWKHLPEGATLHFWRSTSGAEVDFVLARSGRQVGIEVKAQGTGRPALSRSSRSFLDAYRPKAFWVVNTGFAHLERLEATQLRWLEPAELAGAVAEAFE